jgi:hypothetical protein
MIGFLIFLLLSMLFFSQGYAQEPEKYFHYKEPQFLYEERCSKCHTLERVFAEPKTEDEWRICVSLMREKNKFWITEKEGKRIVDEIIGIRKDRVGPFPQKKKYEDAQLLFIDRCTKCHTVSRILNKDRTKEEWEETVLRMRDNAPELFLEEDIPSLIEYLVERGRIMRDDVAAQIMVEKCIICHEYDRILLVRKSKEDWVKCIMDMRTEVRERLKKDWFTRDEFKLIIDLLVKTQGIEESDSP